jgi:toxin ParE1/3/4
MNALDFPRRAETDLLEIADYTLRQWGRAQTLRYLEDLEKFCRRLAQNPSLGRSCDEV